MDTSQDSVHGPTVGPLDHGQKDQSPFDCKTEAATTSFNMLCFFFVFFSQLDADRDEEEVFCDISMTLDNKLFSSKEPTAGDVVKAQWILCPDPQ